MDRVKDASNLKRILVTGAAGLLGTPLCQQLEHNPNFSCIARTREELDITDRPAVESILTDHRPDWVVNCAAYTKVDDCETNEETATQVNGDGAGVLAGAAANVGANFLHVSTDYVFDGSARNPIPVDAVTGPPDRLSAYGRSKLTGEQRVAQNHPRPTIVRTAWVYGLAGPCFPKAILKLAQEGKLKKVVNDQQGAPTFASDLAEAITKLIQADAHGIFHVTNRESCTWYEFARTILHLARIEHAIEPCSTDAFPRPARRPAYSVLDLTRFENETSHRMRPWSNAISDFLQSHLTDTNSGNAST